MHLGMHAEHTKKTQGKTVCVLSSVVDVQSSRTVEKRATPFLRVKRGLSRASCRGCVWAGSWRTRHGKRGSHGRDYEREQRKCMNANPTTRHWSEQARNSQCSQVVGSWTSIGLRVWLWVAVAACSVKGQIHLSWEAGWQKILCRIPAIPRLSPWLWNTYQSTRKWLGWLALPLESQPAKEPRLVTGDIWTRVLTPLTDNLQLNYAWIWHLSQSYFW